MRVVVIGAGAFGSWTALWMARRGASVTLVDQYGPGSSLSTSGDESRVSRSAHGPDAHYPAWQRRSMAQWRSLAPELWVPTGVLWLVGPDDAFEAASLRTLGELGIPAERLEPRDLEHRFAQFGLEGIAWGLFEPEAGVILARRAVIAAARAAVDAGAGLVHGVAALDDGRVLVNGEPTEADAVVVAAGPWLPKLLGPVPGLELSIPQQEILYFGTPPGDARFDAGRCPTWVEYGAAFYGLPSIESRGFKVAPDWPGPEVDPDRQERVPSAERIAASRAYLRRRFPALADAPVAEGRVCQYELTADTHFIVDRHPDWPGAWIVGGGSGHGFKHAPAIGEYVSALVVGDGAAAQELAPPDARFALRPRQPGIGMRTSGAAPPAS
jgi:glycine/D-amino acid oxidase-like deaminating enzyme